MRDHREPISIEELGDLTSIKTEDIISTMQHMSLIKYYHGQNCIVLPEETLKVRAVPCSVLCRAVAAGWPAPTPATPLGALALSCRFHSNVSTNPRPLPGCLPSRTEPRQGHGQAHHPHRPQVPAVGAHRLGQAGHVVAAHVCVCVCACTFIL